MSCLIRARACLKIAFRQIRVTVCGRFGSNEGGVVGYVDGMRAKYNAKWYMHMAGMNFQTLSSGNIKSNGFDFFQYRNGMGNPTICIK